MCHLIGRYAGTRHSFFFTSFHWQTELALLVHPFCTTACQTITLRLVDWDNAKSFNSRKYSHHCIHKHSLFVYYLLPKPIHWRVVRHVIKNKINVPLQAMSFTVHFSVHSLIMQQYSNCKAFYIMAPACLKICTVQTPNKLNKKPTPTFQTKRTG